MVNTGMSKNAKGVTKKKSTTSRKKSNYQSGRELAIKPKVELKAFDIAAISQTFNSVAGGPSIGLLNAVVNGAELYQRTGRKIYMKSIHIRGVVRPNAAVAANTGELRMLVVYDSQPNGANPTIQNLLQDSNAAAATTVNSEINLTNRSRFQIIRDMQFYTPAAAAADDISGVIPDPIHQTLNVNMFIKLKGLETIYNGVNGGSVADITSGAMFIVFLSDTVVTGKWDFAYQSRLRYYD